MKNHKLRSLITLQFVFAALFAVTGCATPEKATAPQGTALANKRVLWLGDSITQNGNFVTFVEYFLNKNFPKQNYDIISIGLSSETMSGLKESTRTLPRPCIHSRLDRALAETKPALVVACYGMNDGIYMPQSPERMKAFQDGLALLVAKVKAAGAEFILITPPPFDVVAMKGKGLSAEDSIAGKQGMFGGYDSVLADFAKYECALAKSDAMQVIDLHTVMNAELARLRAGEAGANFSFTKDAIHPEEPGHFFMARVILENLGSPVPADVTLESVKADPLFALVKKHRENRSKGWLAYVGYTIPKVVQTDSVTAVETTATELQAQIDTLRRK